MIRSRAFAATGSTITRRAVFAGLAATAALALPAAGQSSGRDVKQQAAPAVVSASSAPKVSGSLASPDRGGAPVTADPIATATREFRSTGIARTVTEGNFVSFPFGHSQPVVTCARLRACIIELQVGEIVLSRIAGDLERWEIAPAPSGADGRTTLVVVKPRDCDLTTNLVLATDRRIYDLTLDSPPCRGSANRGTTNPQDAYVRHVRFYYPDETVAKWAKPEGPRVDGDLTQLNFGYDVRRDKQFPWQPAQVFDDGAHVYIKLPDAARHAEAPALFVLAADGSRTLLNYNLVGDTYVTDRLFDRAVLIAGIDGKERKVQLERRPER
jgi:P-type conjugative transfer protein TrbG